MNYFSGSKGKNNQVFEYVFESILFYFYFITEVEMEVWSTMATAAKNYNKQRLFSLSYKVKTHFMFFNIIFILINN